MKLGYKILAVLLVIGAICLAVYRGSKIPWFSAWLAAKTAHHQSATLNPLTSLVPGVLNPHIIMVKRITLTDQLSEVIDLHNGQGGLYGIHTVVVSGFGQEWEVHNADNPREKYTLRDNQILNFAGAGVIERRQYCASKTAKRPITIEYVVYE